MFDFSKLYVDGACRDGESRSNRWIERCRPQAAVFPSRRGLKSRPSGTAKPHVVIPIFRWDVRTYYFRYKPFGLLSIKGSESYYTAYIDGLAQAESISRFVSNRLQKKDYASVELANCARQSPTMTNDLHNEIVKVECTNRFALTLRYGECVRRQLEGTIKMLLRSLPQTSVGYPAKGRFVC